MKRTRTNRYPLGHVSLERALSKLGLASRTVGREWIEAGRVSVNGKVVKNPKSAVHPEKAKIKIDGEAASAQSFVAYILNKPKNVVCTRSDEKGRQTIFSIITHDKPHLHSVGRLDYATTGLLLLTNDTRLSDWLTDPEQEIPRTYVVTVRGEITEEKYKTLCKGVKDEGEFLKPQSVVLKKTSGKESHLEITLTEGKNREIRRLMLAVGCEVTALKRISYGPLELGNLGLGEYTELSLIEILSFFPEAKTKLKL